MREYAYPEIQDADGAYVTEAEWHRQREEARLDSLPRLNRSEAMRLLRLAVFIGVDDDRRHRAWQKLRDHRVVLKTLETNTVITEEMWRGWLAEGKFCHDPRGCVMTEVDEDS